MGRPCVSYSLSISMPSIKHSVFVLLSRVANKFGYAMIGLDELNDIRRAIAPTRITVSETSRESPVSISMPNVSVKEVDGARLLSLKVWTEGPKPCANHKYNPVKSSNSHSRSSRIESGAAEHLDFVCSECTHKMCVSKWGEND